jgi:site-specific recombinase XerD
LNGKIKLHIKPSKRGKERDTYYIFGSRWKDDILNYVKNPEFSFKTKTIEKQIERISKKLNIETLSTHSFRHTFATMFLTMGGSIETLSKLLGHDDISTTQIYGEIVNLRIENEIEKLNQDVI